MRAFDYTDMGVHQVLLAGLKRLGDVHAFSRMPRYAMRDYLEDESWTAPFIELMDDREEVWNDAADHDTNPLVEELRRTLGTGERVLVNVTVSNRLPLLHLHHLPSRTNQQQSVHPFHEVLDLGLHSEVAAFDLPPPHPTKLEFNTVLGVFAGKAGDLWDIYGFSDLDYDPETNNWSQHLQVDVANVMLVQGFARIVMFTNGEKVGYTSVRLPSSRIIQPSSTRVEWRHNAWVGEDRTPRQPGRGNSIFNRGVLRPYLNEVEMGGEDG